MVLNKYLIGLLENREFISVATCDFKGRPNAAPKFLLKVQGDIIYMVDYIIGTTCENLRMNPYVSLSFLDSVTLKGYQINGKVGILEKGRLFNKLYKEMMDKEIRLTTKHIIEDIRGKGKHDSFEVVITERFVILEVKVNEVVEIGIQGKLKRTKSQL